MARGISLHIGLNHVDTSAYPDYTIPVLAGCINDANAMQNIAQTVGFTSCECLIDGQATALNVKNKIIAAANELTDGDFFFLTYSGHGGQLPDETGMEEDGSNETWILYDRQLIDDELYAIWPQFAQGVRLFVLSDSCHSGTMVKYIMLSVMAEKRRSRSVDSNLTMQDMEKIAGQVDSNNKRGLMRATNRNRAFPVIISLKNYLMNKSLYQNIQQLTKLTKDVEEIKASLIYISGCQDNQLSGDGDQNGRFTGELLDVWNNGNFSGTYNTFYDQIIANMPSDQTPNYMTLGVNLPVFENQKPFTLMASATEIPDTGGEPSVSAADSWNDTAVAPTFNVNKGSNPFYYVEVATENRLFNYDDAGAERNDSNFYATWNDASINYMLFDSPQYQLPQSVWDEFKGADYLFYRIGTTVDAQWNGWKITTTDEDYGSAPYMQIIKSELDDGTDVEPEPQDPAEDPLEDPVIEDDNTENNGSRIMDSVGASGKNDASDVRIIQKLLKELSAADGGTPSVVEDGDCGPATITAIKSFQRANELNQSGLFRPDKGSVILLYLKSGIATMEYA